MLILEASKISLLPNSKNKSNTFHQYLRVELFYKEVENICIYYYPLALCNLFTTLESTLLYLLFYAFINS